MKHARGAQMSELDYSEASRGYSRGVDVQALRELIKKGNAEEYRRLHPVSLMDRARRLLIKIWRFIFTSS